MSVKLKIKNTFKTMGEKMRSSLKRNFLFATLNFVFIFVFIQGFNFAFGAENSVIAIILAILMGIYAGRDVSSSPFKQFFMHVFVLAAMCTAACFSVYLGPWIAIPINLVMAFCILYAYTYDYANHLYFPYILSYLFLVYISPVEPAQLSFRLLSVAAGTFVMLIYALVLRPRNIVRPAKNAVLRLLEIAESGVRIIAEKRVVMDLSEYARCHVYELSRNADMRRKGARKLPEATFALLNVGRGMENIIALLADSRWTDEKYDGLWQEVTATLEGFKNIAARKSEFSAEICAEKFATDEYAERLRSMLEYVRDNLSKAYRKNKANADKIKISFKQRLKSLLAYSPMKLTYALRVSILLTAFMIPIQYFGLAHGKWLMFTLASVSLPYADDVRRKGQKRMLATLIGGAIATILYALIPNAIGRTAIMMLSGYLSFYFPGYTGNYACATVGALGGAVAAGAFGWADVSILFAIRVGYIALGIVVAYVANLALFPYRRQRASETLYRKYEESVARLCALDASVIPDKQTYYDLVIQNNLLEDKLLKNSSTSDKRDEIINIFTENRHNIRTAHQEAFKNNTA